MPNHYQLISNNGQAPSDEFKLGLEYDVDGERGDEEKAYWCVLVSTPYGMLPGKASGDKAWYTYIGKSFLTEDFNYLKADKLTDLSVTSQTFPPVGAITGKLQDGGVSYMVICYNGERGSVPGRSDGKKAWFSMDSKEYETDNFAFVSLQGKYRLLQNIGQLPVDTDCKLGYNENHKQSMWSVLCNTPNGALIPGSAIRNKAWYTRNGIEVETANFMYIRPLPGYEATVVESSSPPKGTIQGRSKSGADLYMVICDVTEVTGNHFGQLPGFTRDGKNVEACYGGKVKGGYINMIKWLIIHALKNLEDKPEE